MRADPQATRLEPNRMPDAPSRLAIFDHDGVLVDSYDLHEQAWLELGRRRGLPITRDLVRRTFGMTNPDIFRELFDQEIDPTLASELGFAKEQCYRDVARPRIRLMDGVAELLDNLQGHGFALAIGSSGPRANLALTIDVCGLADRFSAIVGLEDIHRGKPDPEVFRLAADRAGIAPAQSVVFEDATIGIEAARAAGMLAVGVGTTHPPERLLEAGADLAVPNLVGFNLETIIARVRQGPD